MGLETNHSLFAYKGTVRGLYWKVQAVTWSHRDPPILLRKVKLDAPFDTIENLRISVVMDPVSRSGPVRPSFGSQALFLKLLKNFYLDRFHLKKPDGESRGQHHKQTPQEPCIANLQRLMDGGHLPVEPSHDPLIASDGPVGQEERLNPYQEADDGCRPFENEEKLYDPLESFQWKTPGKGSGFFIIPPGSKQKGLTLNRFRRGLKAL